MVSESAVVVPWLSVADDGGEVPMSLRMNAVASRPSGSRSFVLSDCENEVYWLQESRIMYFVVRYRIGKRAKSNKMATIPECSNGRSK